MVAGLGRAALEAQLDFIRERRDWLLREIERYQQRRTPGRSPAEERLFEMPSQAD
jgi:hypothetical protein